MSDKQEKQEKLEEVFEAFKIADIVSVMQTREGRRTIAAILEICMHEQSAIATNSAALAANVARQDISHTLKNWVWTGGGKALWRTMEDEIEINIENEEAHEAKLEQAESLDLG